MRKTKLIILPTKCLNRLGFLLLYLSCPVIGDWGRNRPDTEMSQWSILLDKEGSCGLIRNSREHELVPNGWTEYQQVSGGTPRNDTSFVTGYSAEADKGKPEVYGRVRRKSERRIARRETRERRTVSLDRRSVFRRVDDLNRNYRNIPQDRRSDARRLSLDRRVRSTNEVTGDNARNKQRGGDSRRMGNAVESRRVEKRRLSRRVENSDGAARRVSSEIRRSSRVGDVENRNPAERRERREDRRTVFRDRSSSEREVIQARRKDNPERSSPRRVRTRRDENRTAPRLTVRRERSESRIRRNSVTSDTRRNERSFERRETSLREEVKRSAVEFSRRQTSRGRESQKREVNAREKMPGVDRYGGVESRISKLREEEGAGESKWQLLRGIKNWFRQNTKRESWVINNDFATTCLVGASVYLLTTRQVKAI